MCYNCTEVWVLVSLLVGWSWNRHYLSWLTKWFLFVYLIFESRVNQAAVEASKLTAFRAAKVRKYGNSVCFISLVKFSFFTPKGKKMEKNWDVFMNILAFWIMHKESLEVRLLVGAFKLMGFWRLLSEPSSENRKTIIHLLLVCYFHTSTNNLLKKKRENNNNNKSMKLWRSQFNLLI